MRYKILANLYEELNSTTKRLEKIDILSKFLEDLDKKDSYVLYLLEGRIYPNYVEKRIGISNQLVIKSLSKSFGMDSKKIINEWKKIGDLGEVSKKLSAGKKQTTLMTSKILTTKKVIKNLRKLPELEGQGTISKKISLITELMTSASPIEMLYLVRILLGDLRIGVQESTIKYAILKAFYNNNKEYEEKLQRAIDRSNDLAEVFEIAKKKNPKELEKIKLQVGKPIKAMLAQKTKSIKQAFKDLGKPLQAEFKYDGFRLMIHKKDDKIMLFTRSLENVTKQFPEVVEYIKAFVKGKSFILDSEAVGYDKKTKKYTDFQKISQRIRRKYNINELRKKLPVEVNVFDIIYYNGKSQLNQPFKKRSELIREIIKNQPYKLITSKKITTSNEEYVEKFYKKALKENQEGLMLKNLEAPYKPGRRVGNMLKLKPEDNELDLVITGAEWGTGKRSGWLSSFTLSCSNENKFLEVGKVGTGISELESKESEENKITFKKLTELLKPHIISEKNKNVKITPHVVVMVSYQDIQRSPNYKSGWALRFPRILRLREDKSIKEIATIEEIEKDFLDQRAKNYKYG